ncbi:hypothetical protein RclHR1_03270007 [Rhizophagus clarus]|uniref:F-box domain-containing protein n=1 Tax=Rhizophagus clarus TaxID=94130 RepID=A0A2Z6RKC8_9GLOM|nr:hypothetical protein RclHR1_03270007 [Rhizophagus clarus]GES74733.1 hypothetical protein GLOIN_2v1785452 [Rhizophagus clarus]
MFRLNRDVLYLIFQEFKDDNRTLYSCLTVNKTWCEIIIPILWKDPWKYLKENYEHRRKKLLLNVITSQLSDELKNNSTNQGINFMTNSSQKPFFDYIGLCRHLNLEEIHRIINSVYEQSKTLIVKNEIFKLFINENTKFTHIYLPYQFDHQIHLFPKAERCFSEIEFFSCSANINDNVLAGLTGICKSIKELELFIEVNNNNNGIIDLINNQKNLLSISLLINYAEYSKTYGYTNANEEFCKNLESSLIEHANTIQYFKTTKQPIVKIISHFVKLKELDLDCSYYYTWNCLENLSLPFLRILKASRVPIRVLTSLIENTSGTLIEIKIDYIFHNEIDNKRIIEAIYRNCPNLKYLKLVLRNSNISVFEKLLINCQYLEGLFILINNMEDAFDLENLFKVLTRSSPFGLFRFKFSIYSHTIFKLETLKLFFDNWKNRRPMLLQFNKIGYIEEYTDLIAIYKSEGIVKKFSNLLYEHTYGDFEWV